MTETHKELCIVIANTAEAFADLLERSGTGGERHLHELDLASRGILWGGDSAIVIAPNRVSPQLLQRTRLLFSNRRLDVWCPAKVSLRLCADIAADAELMDCLRREMRHASRYRLLPYAITHEFCALCEALGLNAPERARIAAAEIDSKVGFRRALGEIVPLPEGEICESFESLSQQLAAMVSAGRSAVAKVHNGESGWGLRKFQFDELAAPGADAVAKMLSELRRKDPIWSAGPYVAEELISHVVASPSGEGRVEDGHVRFDYLCDQVVGPDGVFLGVHIGKEVEAWDNAPELKGLTLRVGEALAARQYAGTFDVDFIVTRARKLFAVESNVRMTGGTHVFNAARRLFGDDWYRLSFVSNDEVRYGSTAMPASQLLDALAEMLITRATDRGVIVTFIGASRPTIGLIGVGASRMHAESILRTAAERLTRIFGTR